MRFLHICMRLAGLLCLISSASAQSLPPEVTQGRDWLAAQVSADGSVAGEQATIATVTQTRAEVLATLNRFTVATPALFAALVEADPAGAVEHLSRKVLAAATVSSAPAALVDTLKSYQNADGGFAGGSSYASNVLDTSFALIALRAAGEASGDHIARAVSFLAARVGDIDNAGLSADAGSRPYVAAYILLALQTHAQQYPIGDAVDQARGYLLAQQGAGAYTETLLNAVSAIALGFSSTSGTGLDAARLALLAAQRADGSWEGDPYLSALALRGLINSVATNPPETGRVVATVRDANGLVPIAGALMRLSGDVSLEANSAPDGQVQIDDIPPGNYDLVIDKSGYLPATAEGLTVSAGGTLSMGFVDLQRVSTEAVLRGRVTDVRDGSPLAGAEVSVSGAAVLLTSTGPDGRYELLSDIGGGISIEISLDGYQATTASANLALGSVLEFSPALYPDDLPPPPPTAVLVGRVVAAVDGQAIAGALIAVGSAQTQSAADGTFLLSELAVGSALLSVSADQYLTAVQDITLAPGVNNRGDIQLLSAVVITPISSVSGLLTDADNGTPIAGALIEVVETAQRASSAADGRYLIESINVVPFQLSVTAPGYRSQTLSVAAAAHADFTVDAALERLTGGDFVLESVVVSGPEFDPYTEVGLLGTVRNQGSQEAGLIFNAIVLDANQQVVRDVPAVRIVFNSLPAENILSVPAGGTRVVPINWGLQADPAGDYMVIFRGVTPSGQVALEGTVGYRVRAVRRIGGSVRVDPPLLQAGLGQSVQLDAALTNLGNLPIAAGNANLTVTLVQADNSPPGPAVPVLGDDVLVGAPLNRPWRSAQDDQGNLYTINYFTRELVKIEQSGNAVVLMTLNRFVNGVSGAQLGNPSGLAYHPDGRLRVAWSGAHVSAVELDPPYVQNNLPGVTTGTTAYAVDAVGNEYFGGKYESRTRVVKRSLGGELSVLADSGVSSASAIAIGPDQSIYLSDDRGWIFRVDSQTGVMSEFASGFNRPEGLLFEADGSLLVAESIEGRIRRLRAGVISDFVTDIYQPSELRRGLDGAVYVLSGSSELRKVLADGSHSHFASGLVSDVVATRFDEDGRILALSGTQLRRRNHDGSAQTLATGFFNSRDFLQVADDEFLILGRSTLNRVIGGQITPVLNQPSFNFSAIARSDSGEILVLAQVGSRRGVYQVNGSELAPIEIGPTAVRGLAQAGNESILWASDQLFSVSTDGQLRSRGEPFGGLNHVSGGVDGGLYAYETGGIVAAARGLYRVEADGSRIQLSPILPGFSSGIALDDTGRILYGKNDRTISRFDGATGQFDVLVSLPGSGVVRNLAYDASGSLYVRTNLRKLYRLEGAVLVQLADSVDDLVTQPAGSPWWRSGTRLYTLDANNSIVLKQTLSTNPTSFLALGADRTLTWRSLESRFEFLSASGIQEGKVELIGVNRSLAVLGDSVFVTDTRGRLTHFPLGGGPLRRLGGDSNQNKILRVDQSRLLTSRVDGVYQLDEFGAASLFWSNPTWARGHYGQFDVAGDTVLAARVSTRELMVAQGESVLVTLAPFSAARSFAQRHDGRWVVASGTSLIEVDNDGLQSRVVSTSASGIASLSRSNDELLALNSAKELLRIALDYQVQPIAAPAYTDSASAYALATANGEAYAITRFGQVYRRDGEFFRSFASGVSNVRDLQVDSAGQVYVLDGQANSLGLIDQTGYRQIATGFGNPLTMTLQSDDTVLIATNTEFVVSDVRGRWSRRLWPRAFTPSAIANLGSGRAWVFDYASRIFEVGFVEPPPPIEVGTVVLERSLAYTAFDTSAVQNLGFSTWVPPVAGDYELSIQSTDPDVTGRASTGLHVGPNANAVISALPAAAKPGSQQIDVRTHVEGGDFSTLSRIETSQLQLLLPQAIYPTAMGADAAGGLWYVTAGKLYRAEFGASQGEQIGSDAFMAFRGEVPIDSEQRAYAVVPDRTSNEHWLRRYDSQGGVTTLVTVNEPIQSLTIDELDRIYMLAAGKVYRLSAAGDLEVYAELPEGTPYGLTRDGLNNLYVQMRNNVIYRVDSARAVTTILSDARFEYEGVNITGTCAEGLFFTPTTYPRVGQNGEEYTIAQVLGSTGQIGPIFNGRLVSADLTDIDFIVYDRFSSNLLVFSENYSNGRNGLFRIPVTCGATDVDFHIVMPADQPAIGINPPPTQTIVRADGSSELIWELRDVNAQGVDLRFSTELADLQRGERRPVAQDAFIEFRNSFVDGTLRIPVDVPRVLVEDLVETNIQTDQPSYGQNTEVGIAALLRNLDSQTYQGRLLLTVVDADGGLVESLIDRIEIFGPLEERELYPPFFTGNNRAGDYRALLQVFDLNGQVVAESSAEFAITAGDGTPAVASTVATDRTQYGPEQTVVITGALQNESQNLSLQQLSVTETVTAPDGSEFFVATQIVPNLEPSAAISLSFETPLGAASPGSYSVRQEVRDNQGLLLSSATTGFEVIVEQGNDALSGSLTIAPSIVEAGTDAQLSASVHNRGNVDLMAVPLSLQLIDPAQSGAVIAQWSYSRDIALGQSIDIAQPWSTVGVAAGSYIGVLSAQLGGETRVLDQQTVTVASLQLSGTISVDPAQASASEAIALQVTAANAGNLNATALPFTLTIIADDTGLVAREWSYSSDLAAAAQVQFAQTVAAGSLPIGDYSSRWVVSPAGQSQLLAEATFRVVGIAITGAITATPGTVGIGEPVQLIGTINNGGNLPATDLPVRIEVRRLDTQTLIDSWTDTATVAESGSYVIQRQWTGVVAAQYEAQLSVQLLGQWQTVSGAPIEVTAPAVDVDLQIGIHRDGRLLVLVSCEPGEAAAGGSDTGLGDDDIGAGRSPAPSDCALERQTFVEQYLSVLAIEHKVVTSAEDFMAELRCGRYNTYWLSGGSEKLAEADAKELRESIYRGEGLLIDGSHDQRTSYIDEIAGYDYRGHISTQDLTLHGAGTLFPPIDIATYGGALRLEASTGQIEASFVDQNSAAIISNSYGQGRALSYAFDLVEVLKRDSALPGSAGLFDNGLLFVAPSQLSVDYAAGSYVPVTTTVENRSEAVDLRLLSSITPPASLDAAAPSPTLSDAQSATWDFNLPASQIRQFDLGVRSAGAASDVLSELSQRVGPLLEPLSNVSQALPLRDVSQTSSQLILELQSAQLSGGENASRNRAIGDIEDALELHVAGDAYAAIGKWIDAGEEVVRIDSVPHQSWRLAIARLLETSQRESCGELPPTQSCDVLGVAGDYNGFFFGNYSAGSSDVQGRLAAAGDISINHYSIADQLPANFEGASLVAGGDLSFPSGRVYTGDIVVGGSAAGVGSPVINGLGPNQQLLENAAMPVDFAAEQARLIAESARLATLSQNATWQSQWGGLYLHGDGQSALQVFNLHGPEVLSAHTFAVDGIPDGATVLFNIDGSAAGLTNMSMSSLVPYRSKVLFNFHQATSLQLGGISVEGSVLAPMADINNPQGVIWGSVVAQSWNGMMQINLVGYAGCTAAGDDGGDNGGGGTTGNLCDSEPSAPVLVDGQGQFAAFGTNERLEVRGGKPGNASWEWSLGANTRASGQSERAQLDWVSGRSYRFELSHDGSGNGSYEVFDGATSLLRKDYIGQGNKLLDTGNALQLYIKAAAGVGTAKILVSPTNLSGGNLNDSLESLGDNALNESRLTYYYPEMAGGFVLEGSIRLDFNGSSPPNGSRLNFMATAGNLTCNGVAP